MPSGLDPMVDTGFPEKIMLPQRARALISNGTAVDIDRLTGDELAGVRGQKKRGAACRSSGVMSRLIMRALSVCGLDFLHHHRMREHALAGGEARQ